MSGSSSCEEDLDVGITLEQLHELARQREAEREKALSEEEECSEDENECKRMKIDDPALNASDDDGLTVLTQHASKGKPGPVQYQLPKWVTQYCPIEQDISAHSVPLDSFSLHPKITANLQTMGITRLFPVQATIIPAIIDTAKGPLLTQPNGIPPSDLCICAPTGCGKTLAYVVPIVHAILTECSTCALRALVVVPSQDLALQVSSVFRGICKGSKVKCGVLCGQKTLDEEIMGVVSPLGGSKVDVIVCTPGRLVSHLQRPHSLLVLSNLRYLIIDEADRIFEQHYHNWLEHVVGAVTAPVQCLDIRTSMFSSSSVPFLFPELVHSLPKLSLDTEPGFHSKAHSCSPSFSVSTSMSDILSNRQPLQKLLFSATLSLDPEKLSMLCLNRPKLYSVSQVKGERVGEGELPSTLTEYMLVSSMEHKPLYLIYLVKVLEDGNSVICFVHSKFSTYRLTLVLQQYNVSVEEVSANVSQEARKAIVKRFESGKTKVLVCSDGMSRGMDIESVKCVINYDAPAHFKSYLHRVGRTARAGAEGTAYTILTREEVGHFNKIVRSARGKQKIKKIAVSDKDIQPFTGLYSQALDNVAAIVGQ